MGITVLYVLTGGVCGCKLGWTGFWRWDVVIGMMGMGCGGLLCLVEVEGFGSGM